jgi:hypothetical protein
MVREHLTKRGKSNEVFFNGDLGMFWAELIVEEKWEKLHAIIPVILFQPDMPSNGAAGGNCSKLMTEIRK